MNIKKLLIIEYVLLAGLLIFNIVLYKNDIYQQLKEWKLVYIPESFTELYFTDHLNLPTTITAGADQSFLFTIHNLENQYMEYSWEVYQIPDIELYGDKTVESSESSQSDQNTETQNLERTETWEFEHRIVVGSGFERMRNDETKSVSVTFKVDKIYKRQKIEVNLVGLGQTIHYWVVGK